MPALLSLVRAQSPVAWNHWPLLFAFPVVLPMWTDGFDVRWFPYRWFWLYGVLYVVAMLTWFHLRFLRPRRKHI